MRCIIKLILRSLNRENFKPETFVNESGLYGPITEQKAKDFLRRQGFKKIGTRSNGYWTKKAGSGDVLEAHLKPLSSIRDFPWKK